MRFIAAEFFGKRCVIVFAALAALLFLFAFAQVRAQSTNDLRAPSDFANIQDTAARSKALFTESTKVITSPRCMNCHPAGNHPLQGDDKHVHEPPVARGPAGTGVAGNTCAGCHNERNFTLPVPASTYESIPGHPRWGLAPVEMAWEGKSVSEICTQLKDKARNGGRDLALLHEHVAKDDLVAWGWNPGPGRNPAPGTQQRLGELIQAWIDAGAHCP
jgi:cytochrome c5